ncbi:hypothetical protein C8Q78DRAFT_106021 [Trametes maxima]|nr:hypothetical protein C8Q78DRAFT_106021 [Trametes maxima]
MCMCRRGWRPGDALEWSAGSCCREIGRNCCAVFQERWKHSMEGVGSDRYSFCRVADLVGSTWAGVPGCGRSPDRPTGMPCLFALLRTIMTGSSLAILSPALFSSSLWHTPRHTRIPWPHPTPSSSSAQTPGTPVSRTSRTVSPSPCASLPVRPPFNHARC